MASKEPIDSVYTRDGTITENALFTVYKAEINLDKFDYDMLYAYTQVSGLTLDKRAEEAEKFAQKLGEKNLDNQTIRTILETQNIELPPKSATFIKSTSNFETDFFEQKQNLFLYTQHPNLITIYASGMEENSAYAATESLANQLATEKLFETFTLEGKINLVIQVSRAVASLHSNNIIHHNICPDNIFALPQANGICQIKLLACGIIPDINQALNTGGGSEFKPLFAFIPPEILLQSVTEEAHSENEDIYALGSILYFYLSGKYPWKNSRTLFDIIQSCKAGEDPLSNDDFINIPVNIKSVIIKATHKNPDKRYNNVAELIADLEACRDGQEPAALAILKGGKNFIPEPNITEEEILKSASGTNSSQNPNTSKEEESITNQNLSEEKPEYKSERTLTEADLPQPIFEPKITDINEISADMNKTGSQIWTKLLISACILLVAGGIGYYFFASKPATTEPITPPAAEDNNPTKTEEPKVTDKADDTTTQSSEPTPEEIAAEKALAAERALAAKKAEEEQLRQQRLQEEQQRKLNTDYQQALEQGNQAMLNNEYETAIIAYSKAYDLKNTVEAQDLLQTAEKKQEAEIRFTSSIDQAKQLLLENKLEEAEAIILQAKTIPGFNSELIATQLLDDIRHTRFNNALAEGENHLAAGEYTEAELAYSWALSIPGYEDNTDALNGRQLVQDSLRRIAEEATRKEEEERKHQAEYTAAISEGDKLFAQRRWDEAVAAYNMALEVPGYTEDQNAYKGRENALSNKEIELQRLAEARINALQNEYNRFINNGNTFLQARMWSEAEDAFNNALKVEGYSNAEEAVVGRKRAIENGSLATNRAQYDQLLLIGAESITRQDYPAAAKAFRDALLIPGFDNATAAKQGISFAEESNQIISKAKEYNQYLDSGREKLLSHDAIAAARDFGRAIVIAPDQIDTYTLRGSAYLEADNTQKAFENFDEALQVRPNYPPAILGRAITFYKAEDYPAAAEAFKAIISTAEDNETKILGNNTLGWIYLETEDSAKNSGIANDNDLAQEYFEKSIPLNDPIASNNLGYMYMYGRGVDKDYAKAISLFEAAAEAGLPEGAFNLGMAYYKGNGVKRNYTTAFGYFERAAQNNTLPIAWGQLAEMYRRGRGVERDRDLVREYSARYNGDTNRETEYIVSKPKITLPLPINYLPTNLPEEELAKQYTVFYNLGDELNKAADYESAERLYLIADKFNTQENSAEIEQRILEIRELQTNRKNKALAETTDNKNIEELDDDLLAGESVADLAKELEELTPTPQTEVEEESSELDDILASLETKDNTVAESQKPAINDSRDLLARLNTEETEEIVETEVIQQAKTKPADIDTSKFGKEYVKLINLAEKYLSNQKWLLAEQAFRLALALPDSPDQGDAHAGLQAAINEKESADTPNNFIHSDYAAIISNATSLLKEAQWPQAIYLFQSAIDYNPDDDDTLAQIGLDIAEKANTPVIEEELTELGVNTDERDIASYNMAIAQSKQFLANGNYAAAIQMLEIALQMKGFEEDPVASALLISAEKMRLEHDNSPEAIAAKQAKNKPIYDKLIQSGELQITSNNLEGAKNSYELALKIPGYEKDPVALAGLKQIEEFKTRQAISSEARDKYNTLMNQGRAALDAEDWPRAEETFRIILSLPDFSNDPEALSGLRTAAQAQNKPLPQIGDINEDILQNGLIPADADLEAIRKRAEFEALLREGKRQLELKQFEVAEAMFNEALKIDGYTTNPDAIRLLQQTIVLKPKEPEVEIPEQPETEVNPQAEMEQQATMLLNEGNRLRALQQFDKAIQAYSSGIDLDPDNPRLRINRADTNAGLGKFDLALNDYMKVLDSKDADTEVKSYAWNNIANVYYYGKKDYSSAVEFYKKAAEVGNLASMNSLGVCYGFAKGVEKDPQASLEWYTKAAEGGYGNAMLNLGMMYQNGWGY